MTLTATQHDDLRRAVRALERAEARLVQTRAAARRRLGEARKPPEGEPQRGSGAWRQNRAVYEHQARQRVKAARDATEAELARLAEDVDSAAAVVDRLSSAVWPDTTEVGHAAQDRAWARIVRQLDAGVTPARIVRDASEAELVAMRREYPAYARARQAADPTARSKGRANAEVDLSGFHAAAEARLAQVYSGDRAAAVDYVRRGRALAEASRHRIRGARMVDVQGADALVGLTEAFRARAAERVTVPAAEGEGGEG